MAGAQGRDIELAITALKKGAHLLKYGRRGKPKFCPFRLSNDESTLLWFSGKEEKVLKLSHVAKIIPGQRTPIFQRYPRPEKEYQSFSLIYDDRSLDLICKDKDEAEVWFTALKSLISCGHRRKGRIEMKGRVEMRSGFSSEATSPRAQTRTSSPLSSAFGSGSSSHKDVVDALLLHTPFGIPPKIGIEKAFSDAILYAKPPKVFLPPESACRSNHSLSSIESDGAIGCANTNNGDTYRVSLSSAFSLSSQGSGHDEGDSLGDVYLWGHCTGDSILGGGIHRNGSHLDGKMDSLLPKVLESAVPLDVQNIACGGQHAALVTKRGEVFSWGQELGGRLGHGVDCDVSHPKLIDSLKSLNVELVACGEYHSCAVTLSGEMYTWGGSTCNFEKPEVGYKANRWVPRKLDGPLEGIHVSSISCGPWHTAVVTSAGKLFTFGEGNFGVLGHGDCQSVSLPREVESLKGLRTVRASCGVWHTAAVVEVMNGASNSTNCSSGKIFTWGDGDKGRLGHGDREARLVPTCVAALVEPNFCQVACGHSMTVALTTTGQVYTMGSPVYGQLGNPKADGRLPTRVEGSLVKNFIEEIACGAYHVAVLTSKSEAYTWGKGANGRLGHGDIDDRNSPSLVEALTDKQVKSIACGTTFTTAICLHKWPSGVDQSVCSGCRLPFNFKRKRHSCYNCGSAFCHSCSSARTLKASMAPVPNKAYRVCDSCFKKLMKHTETNSSSHSALSRGENTIQVLTGLVEKANNLDFKTNSHHTRNSSIELSKKADSRFSKRNRKLGFNSNRALSPPTGVSQPNANSKSGKTLSGSSKKFFSASLPGSRIVSRASSPTSKRCSSPPRPITPTPILSAIASSKLVVDDVKRKNDRLSEEVNKLRAQVEELTCQSKLREVRLERTTKQLKETIALAGEETIKCKAAKEVIKSLTAQLRGMAEKLPVGAARNGNSPSFSSAASEHTSNPRTCHKLDSNASNVEVSSNGSSTNNNTDDSLHSEPTAKIRSRTKVEPNHGDEWVEQDEAGVYITLAILPGGAKDLKRVRFSRKRFSEKQAEKWWAANRARLHHQYNVPMTDKPSFGMLKEGLTAR